MDPIDVEIVWERYSELVETIRCDQRGDEPLMSKKDFEKAAVELAKDKWTKEPPTRQGEYWHWDGNPDMAPFALSVMWSGTSQKCFVCIKDVPTAPWCDEYGGWWMRIVQPKVPQTA